MRNSEKFPSKKLIVEGQTDLYAIAALRDSAKIEYNFVIVVYWGRPGEECYYCNKYRQYAFK